MAEDSASGDASSVMDDKLRDLFTDEKSLLEQYQLFCTQMRVILENVSGFPVPDIGLTLDDFRAMLEQYGLTSAYQLLAESDKFRLVFQPQVVVLRNSDEIVQDDSDKPHHDATQSRDSKKGIKSVKQAKSAHVFSEDIYVYPNKLIFQ